jgi:hypothetical protein
LTTVPSMKAMLDASIVAASTHRPMFSHKKAQESQKELS